MSLTVTSLLISCNRTVVSSILFSFTNSKASRHVYAKALKKVIRSLFLPPMLGQENTQVVVGLCIIRFDLQGLGILGNSLFDFPLLGQERSQVIVHLWVIGFDSQGLMIMGSGLFELPLIFVPRRIVRVGIGIGVGLCMHN